MTHVSDRSPHAGHCRCSFGRWRSLLPHQLCLLIKGGAGSPFPLGFDEMSLTRNSVEVGGAVRRRAPQTRREASAGWFTHTLRSPPFSVARTLKAAVTLSNLEAPVRRAGPLTAVTALAAGRSSLISQL